MYGNKFFPEGYASLKQQYWEQGRATWNQLECKEYPLETAESNLNVNFMLTSQF